MRLQALHTKDLKDQAGFSQESA